MFDQVNKLLRTHRKGKWGLEETLRITHFRGSRWWGHPTSSHRDPAIHTVVLLRGGWTQRVSYIPIPY